MNFFSIIIPTLNEEKYLPLLLGDLLKQTFQDFEVIVVDSKSEDKTVEKTLEFEHKLPQLTILQSQKRNVSYQRNLGAKKARGKWLLFMDADNRLPSYFLEGIKYKVALEKPDIFTCWCNVDSRNIADKAIANIINVSNEIARMVEQPGALGAMIGVSQKGFNMTRKFNTKISFAEDRKFVREGIAKGLKFKIFQDPKFIYSLRRYKKIGKLKMFQKYAQLELKILSQMPLDQAKDYPMGGDKFLKKSNKETSLIESIQKNLKVASTKPKLLDKVKSLMTLIENGF